jgi:hypothetical protein
VGCRREEGEAIVNDMRTYIKRIGKLEQALRLDKPDLFYSRIRGRALIRLSAAELQALRSLKEKPSPDEPATAEEKLADEAYRLAVKYELENLPPEEEALLRRYRATHNARPWGR